MVEFTTLVEVVGANGRGMGLYIPCDKESVCRSAEKAVAFASMAGDKAFNERDGIRDQPLSK